MVGYEKWDQTANFCCVICRFEQMVRMSVLADSLKSIINAEKAGKRQVMRQQSPLTIKYIGPPQTHLQGRREVPQSHAEGWYVALRYLIIYAI